MRSDRARDIYNKIKRDGVSAIDDFIASRHSEELFLDFKRSVNNGADHKLQQNDRENLAKAISGFGNSEGGVIVWGIDCSRDVDGADVAKAKYQIENVDRFVSLLQNAISGCTLPSHSTVECYGIKTPNTTSGYVITLVPKSMLAPHQCVYNHHYYMRSGSNFTPVPHAVLSGMFGRRPQPWIFLMFSVGPAKINKNTTGDVEILCQIGFMVTNDGQGIARDIFINSEILGLPGKNCKAWYEWTDQANWTGSFAFGFKLGLICKEGFRIPPRNFAQPVVLNLSFLPPFKKEFKLKLKCGCEGSEPFDMEFISDKKNIKKYYNKIIKMKRLENSQDAIGKLLNMPNQDINKEKSNLFE